MSGAAVIGIVVAVATEPFIVGAIPECWVLSVEKL